MLSLDVRRSMGQSTWPTAMNLAIERVRQHGVCVMALKNAHHIGRVGHRTAGLVSVHCVNATSPPVVAPHRGSEARYITNPFTVGVPVPGREPMLLDLATGAIAMGKVRVAYNSEKRPPGNVLMDATGRSTDDPAALFPPAGQPRGVLLPFAEHKGHTLAMVAEVLAAALIGGQTTRPANRKYRHAVWNNMLAMVFDPVRLNDQQLFGAEADAFVEWVQSARLRDAAEPILMPGRPGARIAQSARSRFRWTPALWPNWTRRQPRWRRRGA